MSCHNSRKDTAHKCQLCSLKVLSRCVICRRINGKIGEQSWQSMSRRAVHVGIAHWTLTESALNCDKIEKAVLQKGIQRSFNSPAVSHHGGVWERQIPMARQVLCSIPHKQILDDESLQTLLCEVEAILSSQGLCIASDDKHDPEALTSIHVLLLKSHFAFPHIRSQTCGNRHSNRSICFGKDGHNSIDPCYLDSTPLWRSWCLKAGVKVSHNA